LRHFLDDLDGQSLVYCYGLGGSLVLPDLAMLALRIAAVRDDKLDALHREEFAQAPPRLTLSF
jgi:hypothetical protein